MHRGRVAGRPALGTEPWQRVETTRRLDDIALPPSTRDALREVPAQFSERFWSSAPAAPGADGGRRGLLLLFTGSSDADKYAAAEGLAGELHLPLLRADLAEIFATDRARGAQLQGRLFATAQRLGAVLLLDGADVALDAGGGRAAGLTTVDRAQLVRRSEAHPGIVIFPVADAANAPAGRDAFDAVLDFALPEPAQRTDIWRRALPAEASVTEADIAMLAGAFALPATAILECGTAAAAFARAEGAPVGRPHLGRALAAHYADRRDAENVRTALEELNRPPHLNGSAPPAPAPTPPTPPELDLPTDAVRSEHGGWYEPEQPATNGSAPAATSPPAPTVSEPAPPPPVDTTPPPEPAPDPTPAPAPGAQLEPEPEFEFEPEPPTESHPVAAVAPRAAADRREPEPRAKTKAKRTQPARPPIGPAWLRRPIPLTLLGGLVAAVLGLNAAESGHHAVSRAVPFDRTAAVGGAHVAYPANWAPRSAPVEPGLPLRHATALAATSGAAATLVLGMTSTAVAAPLPGHFVATQIPGSPAPQSVALGPHQFARVLDPRLSLGGPAESVYGLPTATGTFVAVCATRSTAQLVVCERILGTLGGVQPPRTTNSSASAYLSALDGVLAGLNHARAVDGRALATARDAAGEAHAAGALAAAHAGAATAVGRLSAGALAADNGTLAAALRDTAGAYGNLAAAAAKGDAPGYAAAQRAVGSALAVLTRALSTLRTHTRSA